LAKRSITLAELWKEVGFKPNAAQRDAILHTEGPLYLPAGPGSGKTRVLLWRTLNLLVCHDVKPEEIYLSTFTEKAALQLQEGLQALLGTVTNCTGRPFDLSRMYVGTVHSLCQRMLVDRRFSQGRQHPRPPRLLDELEQYFFLYRRRTWRTLLQTVGLNADNEGSKTVNVVFGGSYDSRHQAVRNCLSFFNRLSEECIEPGQARRCLASGKGELACYLAKHELDCAGLDLLVRLYAGYRDLLARSTPLRCTDFSLVQQEAYRAISDQVEDTLVFRHVIVDEYQDTNTIQERLFFRLAEGYRNLCVVGDDDQALYRFRGATVENFVQFPERCQRYLGCEPRCIPLSVNYRSREPIVRYYAHFMDKHPWRREDGHGHYRVLKSITAHRHEDDPAVVKTSCGKPEECYREIAELVCGLIRRGVVQDPSQIAFLFPSLKSVQVGRMIEALEERDLRVYAPRAGRFLEVEEAREMFGVLALLFGTSGLGQYNPEGHGDWNDYRNWLHSAKGRAEELLQQDHHLALYVEDREAELETARNDYHTLMRVIEQRQWNADAPYNIATMKRPLAEAKNLSDSARRNLISAHFESVVRQRAQEGRPIPLQYVLRRAVSVDWTVLDAFYRVCGMDHFRAMFDLAERGEDEGPICNLALISQYLRRFMDEYAAMITADLLEDNLLSRLLFGSYLFALWRLSESEYEDRENPFPKGRIPFLTIHQSKGLEFPVVVLANPGKRDKGPQLVERMVRPFLQRDEGEPLERMAGFDIMRMFYVALSRAKNLLVIANLRGPGVYVNQPFHDLFGELPSIGELNLATVPPAEETDKDLPQSYSYTGDYIAYQRCPRQYMILRQYGFEAARTQTAFFGSLIHQTLDDLHNYLLARREGEQ